MKTARHTPTALQTDLGLLNQLDSVFLHNGTNESDQSTPVSEQHDWKQTVSTCEHQTESKRELQSNQPNIGN